MISHPSEPTEPSLNTQATSTQPLWKPRVRASAPGVCITLLGLLTMYGMARQPAHADGPTWTLPYKGAYTSGGADVFVNNAGTGTAVQGEADNGTGLTGVSVGGSGVYGTSPNGYGVQGVSSNYIGMLGNSGYIGVLGNTSGGGFGVVGQGNIGGVGVLGSTQAVGRSGIEGYNSSAGPGVYGSSSIGSGVYGNGDTGVTAVGGSTGVNASGKTGVYSNGSQTGVYGQTGTAFPYNPLGYAVYGYNSTPEALTYNPGFGGAGVCGRADRYSIPGVFGINTSTRGGAGVFGQGSDGVSGEGTGDGVFGSGANGVEGFGTAIGVHGSATSGASGNYGVYGDTNAPDGNYAGYFDGNVKVTGTLTAAAKNFKIDHPLDPANKYLVHSCVESSEMLNTYSGNIMLDSEGRAVVHMPEWFQAENGDFRYQLTCVGGLCPGVRRQGAAGQSVSRSRAARRGRRSRGR